MIVQCIYQNYVRFPSAFVSEVTYRKMVVFTHTKIERYNALLKVALNTHKT